MCKRFVDTGLYFCSKYTVLLLARRDPKVSLPRALIQLFGAFVYCRFIFWGSSLKNRLQEESKTSTENLHITCTISDKVCLYLNLALVYRNAWLKVCFLKAKNRLKKRSLQLLFALCVCQLLSLIVLLWFMSAEFNR